MFCYFFQAEDGIRELYVTGVQTCALPIWPDLGSPAEERPEPDLLAQAAGDDRRRPRSGDRARQFHLVRSEERRVGKECNALWSGYASEKHIDLLKVVVSVQTYVMSSPDCA